MLRNAPLSLASFSLAPTDVLDRFPTNGNLRPAHCSAAIMNLQAETRSEALVTREPASLTSSGIASLGVWPPPSRPGNSLMIHPRPSDRAGPPIATRDLLKDTLVIWRGAFESMPMSEQGMGRDHNPGGYSFWRREPAFPADGPTGQPMRSATEP